jgi:hypothetical protein
MTRRPIGSIVLFAMILGLHFANVAVQAYPEPTAVIRSWQFDFSANPPQPIAVADASGRTRWYWYVTYKVVNNTGQERMFIPDVTVATDQGQIISAGRNIPAPVFAAIKQRVGNRLLENPTQMVGRLMQGEDYAKESAAIWLDPGTEVGEIRVFFEGLSGETAQITNPLTGKPVLMRKTLMRVYQMPGRPATPQQQTVLPSEEIWVMR